MMNLNRLLQLVAIFAVVGILPAKADFRMGPQAVRPAPEPPAEPASPEPPKFKVAKGYGNSVPLDFAARQIVPPSVRLRFGINVDHHALVTWRGNAPWNHVLADAVRPLGLRVRTGATEVTIFW